MLDRCEKYAWEFIKFRSIEKELTTKKLTHSAKGREKERCLSGNFNKNYIQFISNSENTHMHTHTHTHIHAHLARLCDKNTQKQCATSIENIICTRIWTNIYRRRSGGWSVGLLIAQTKRQISTFNSVEDWRPIQLSRCRCICICDYCKLRCFESYSWI